MRTYETDVEIYEIFTIVNPTHEAAYIVSILFNSAHNCMRLSLQISFRYITI